MAIKVNVMSDLVKTRSGVSKAGKDYTIYFQETMVEFPNGERKRLDLPLEDHKQSHKAGVYLLDVDDLITVGRFGLEMRPFAYPKLITPSAARAA